MNDRDIALQEAGDAAAADLTARLDSLKALRAKLPASSQNDLDLIVALATEVIRRGELRARPDIDALMLQMLDVVLRTDPRELPARLTRSTEVANQLAGVFAGG